MPLQNSEIESTRLPSGIANTYSGLPLTPADGEHWFVRDEGVMYYWDDTAGSWILAAGGGGGGGAGSEILAKIDAALKATATVIVSGLNPTDLQTAITNAVDGDVLEIRTNAVYSQITLPASKVLIIRAGVGYGPALTGTNCILIENGAKDHIVSGLGFTSYTTLDNNAMGAGITFKDQGSKCSNLIFHNLNFEEVTAGSAVMLSYHRSIGGAEYYDNAPQPSEMSDGIAFVSCRGYKACKDATEGSAIALRAFDKPFVYDCRIDGGGLGSRGIQFQNCTNIWAEKNRVQGFITNGEGIKVDSIKHTGQSTAVFNSGWIVDNDAHSCVEGIDCDDDCTGPGVVVYGNRCTDCSSRGISIDGGSPEYARVLAIGNACTRCGTGIYAEDSSDPTLFGNSCWNNTTNYRVPVAYTLPGSNVTTARSAMIPMWKGIDDLAERIVYTPTTSGNWSPVPTEVKGALDTLAAAGIGGTGLMKFTPIGGLAVYMKNSTLSTILKGRVVKADPNTDDSFVETATGDYDPIGIVYEDVASGAWGWIVVAGLVDVYVENSVTYPPQTVNREMWVGVSTSVAGQAHATTVPSPPNSDAHFREIGHTVRGITGPGLVRIMTHYL